MNPRVGIDESDDLATRRPASTVAHCGNDALFYADAGAISCARDVSRTIGRSVVGHDDLDGVGPVPKTCSRLINAIEKCR